MVMDCVDLDLDFKGGPGSSEDLPFSTEKSVSNSRKLFGSCSV